MVKSNLPQQLIQVDASDVALLRATLDLYEQTFTDECESTHQEMEECIQQGKYLVLVLPDGQESIKAFAMIGHISAFNGEFCLLDYFAVAPAFRGNGFGGKFFQMIISFVTNMTPYKIVLLECEERLISFYSMYNAMRTIVPPSLCAGKLFYLLAVSVAADPIYPPSVQEYRTKTAFHEVRANLHHLVQCIPTISIQGGQQIECLSWS